MTALSVCGCSVVLFLTVSHTHRNAEGVLSTIRTSISLMSVFGPLAFLGGREHTAPSEIRIRTRYLAALHTNCALPFIKSLAVTPACLYAELIS